MKHLVYILFTTFFLLFSCAKQTPKGILSEEEAVDLFTEVSLVDAYLNTLPLDSGRKVLPVLYDNLFKQFGIDSNRFKQNVDFYYGNPLLTETVYTKVGEKLPIRVMELISLIVIIYDLMPTVYKLLQLLRRSNQLTNLLLVVIYHQSN